MTAQALGPFLSPVGMRPVPHCSGCDKPSPGRSRFAVLAECPRKAGCVCLGKESMTAQALDPAWGAKKVGEVRCPDGHTILPFFM